MMMAYIKTATLLLLVVLACLLGLQDYRYRCELKKNAALVSINETIRQVNADHLIQMDRMRDQMETMSQQMVRFSDEQQRVLEDKNRKLRRAEHELAELRGEHENIDAFFNVPVPAEFIAWLRTRSIGDPDRDAGDPAARCMDGAPADSACAGDTGHHDGGRPGGVVRRLYPKPGDSGGTVRAGQADDAGVVR